VAAQSGIVKFAQRRIQAGQFAASRARSNPSRGYTTAGRCSVCMQPCRRRVPLTSNSLGLAVSKDVAHQFLAGFQQSLERDLGAITSLASTVRQRARAAKGDASAPHLRRPEEVFLNEYAVPRFVRRTAVEAQVVSRQRPNRLALRELSPHGEYVLGNPRTCRTTAAKAAATVESRLQAIKEQTNSRIVRRLTLQSVKGRGGQDRILGAAVYRVDRTRV
jgi:hypothetical protein